MQCMTSTGVLRSNRCHALQFGAQEPGSNAEVKKFAQARGAKFPIMAKVDVNGSNGGSSSPCLHLTLMHVAWKRRVPKLRMVDLAPVCYPLLSSNEAVSGGA